VSISRRNLMIGAAGLGFGGLALYWKMPHLFAPDFSTQSTGYGPLLSDPDGILDLPNGFSYRIIARIGEEMNDGLLTPGRPDGMAAFGTDNGRVALVCNHENWTSQTDLGAFGENLERLTPDIRAKLYDAGLDGNQPQGGTTTKIYNPMTGEIEFQFLSLGGTTVNCAGGPTPRDSWLTCEEWFVNAGEEGSKSHGYVFEVPSAARTLVQAHPIKAMGKFFHEATATDPRTGIVYMTEDNTRNDMNSMFYRYLPNNPDVLLEGGRLQALAIKGHPTADTSNSGAGAAIAIGARMDVEWIDLDGIDSDVYDLPARGHEQGAAIFYRGEGMWFGRDELYFSVTEGGPNGVGQIWRYIPSPHEGQTGETDMAGQLELFAEPNDNSLMEKTDNLTISPQGHVIFCEDGAGTDHIRGITPEGQIYTIAQNRLSSSELAGVCFSPDGQTMFVNMQSDHITMAITGPWHALRS